MNSLHVLMAGCRDTEAIQSLFPGTNLDLTTATDGLDCLSKLRDLEPDLLVLQPPILWGGCAGVLTRMIEGPDLPPVPVLLLPDPAKAVHHARAAGVLRSE